MTTSEEPDPRLGAELRQGAGSEWAEEAAEDEQLTELMRKRGRTMTDVTREIAHRGDRVTVQFGGHSFGGIISHAGEDYATVVAPGQIADIRFDASIWSVVPAGDSAEPTAAGAETFRELLHECAAAGTRLRLSLPDNAILVGQVAVVAVDHLEVHDADGRVLYLPIDMVFAAIRSTDFQ